MVDLIRRKILKTAATTTLRPQRRAYLRSRLD